MPLTTAQKLKIRKGYNLLTIHAPANFLDDIGAMPEGVITSDKAMAYQQIHWFVKDKAQVEKEVQAVVGLLKEGVLCWIYFPKSSSKIQTDLTRDSGWDALLKQKELHWVSLISFNDTWSACGMRLKTAGDQNKEELLKARPISDYIDAAKKTIRLPEDFNLQLQKAKKEKAFFDSLSFTNRKEYVEWIVTAKRQETRNTRVKESIDRLRKGWKNPANR